MRVFKITFLFTVFFSSKVFGAISPNYRLEFWVSEKNCEKIVDSKCIFRDKFSDKKARFHPTKIVIFQSKALAFQGQNDTAKILKIKDGEHKLLTKNKKLISIQVKDGNVFKVNSSMGSFENSSCEKSQFLYDFFNTYNAQKKFRLNYGFYNDEYDFSPLSEIIVFSHKIEREIMAVSKFSNQKFKAVKNIKLCKFRGEKKAIVKHVSRKDCAFRPINEECVKYYDCQDYLEVKDCKVVYFRGFEK